MHWCGNYGNGITIIAEKFLTKKKLWHTCYVCIFKNVQAKRIVLGNRKMVSRKRKDNGSMGTTSNGKRRRVCDENSNSAEMNSNRNEEIDDGTFDSYDDEEVLVSDQEVWEECFRSGQEEFEFRILNENLIKELEGGRGKNFAFYASFYDQVLKYEVGCKKWKERLSVVNPKGSDRKNQFLATVTDEAMALLHLVNNHGNWVNMCYMAVTGKKKYSNFELDAKYTCGKEKGGDRNKGWSVEGVVEFGRLVELVKKDRATEDAVEFEEYYLKRQDDGNSKVKAQLSDVMLAGGEDIYVIDDGFDEDDDDRTESRVEVEM